MPKHEPERSCIVTREAGSKDGLIRFALAPDGRVVADLAGRLPGRGAWVTASRTVLAEAVRRRLFGRAFKAEVTVAPDLPDEVDRALLRDVVASLSLANKAGAVTSGFTKVEAAIGSGGVSALIHAAEATEDGRRKLAGALKRRAGAPISDIPILDDLGSADLDMALGRVHVIHAALLAGAGSKGCLARWRRLRAYRGVDPVAGGARDVEERSGGSAGPKLQD